MLLAKCPLIIPNVLTANNDGRNDVFVLQNAGVYNQISVQITNRWEILSMITPITKMIGTERLHRMKHLQKEPTFI